MFASAGKGGRGDLRACFVNSSNNSSRSLFFGMLPTKRRWLLKDMVTPILLPFRSSLSFSCKWEKKREEKKRVFFSSLSFRLWYCIHTVFFFRDRTWTEVAGYQRKSGHGYFPKLPTYVTLSRQKSVGRERDSWGGFGIGARGNWETQKQDVYRNAPSKCAGRKAQTIRNKGKLERAAFQNQAFEELIVPISSRTTRKATRREFLSEPKGEE